MRAVVSMAYVLAGMIDGLEMALGRRPRAVTRLRKVKRLDKDEAGKNRLVVEEFETPVHQRKLHLRATTNGEFASPPLCDRSPRDRAT